ncbi:efflux transporter outer membrane subunit [Pseudomonas syringae pv. dysoxyli]|uniref:efflux transporter outer membrane subunit n=1 Tax=Pseudomonas syringae TaxID=317 RepID=UPI0013735BB2|nr:efflux transporter outer membrane subunit [Pseudomonas syringae]NAO28845.1 efflux transporter outer membrane subunit [Pseudomonas syringae pv. dysoxyli]
MNASAFKRRVGLSLLSLSIMSLTACFSMAPEYSAPDSMAAEHFKEDLQAKAEEGAKPGWKTAAPSDSLPRGEWWKVFSDPILDDLEAQAVGANQDLKAALARVKQARAYQDEARARRMPSLDAGFGPTRQQNSRSSTGDGSVNTVWRAQTTVSYEADLFGQVGDSIVSAEAKAQQERAHFASVLLALQADVAANYFELRSLDAQLEAYRRTILLRGEAVSFTKARADDGQVSDLDFERSSTELATARAESMSLMRARAVAEHRLAVLLGQSPSSFTLGSNAIQPVRLNIPAGVPSELLERRPDIAAAERAIASANARIGVAKAAFFPSLTLTGVGGYEGNILGEIFQGSSKAFLLGPLTGTMLNIPLFDGGKRKADLARARAIYTEEVAQYQQTVLESFREVEDNLSGVRLLEEQTSALADAVASANNAARIARAQYQEGAVDYLEVIDAERSTLNTERDQARALGEQAVATVNLIRALGGGWGASSLAKS